MTRCPYCRGFPAPSSSQLWAQFSGFSVTRDPGYCCPCLRLGNAYFMCGSVRTGAEFLQTSCSVSTRQQVLSSPWCGPDFHPNYPTPASHSRTRHVLVHRPVLRLATTAVLPPVAKIPDPEDNPFRKSCSASGRIPGGEFGNNGHSSPGRRSSWTLRGYRRQSRLRTGDPG